MRVIDTDAHFMEPRDWLNHSDPELAAQLPAPRPFTEVFFARITRGHFSGQNMPVKDPRELVTVEDQQFVAKTEATQAEHQGESSDTEFGYYDAAARVAICDAEGIDYQFLSPTMGLIQLSHQVDESGHPELMQRSLAAYNRWATDQVHGYTDRLMPVTQIDPTDIEWSIAEMTRMREAGSRAFRLSRGAKISYTHPDFDPLWSAAEDLGMVAYVHTQFSATPVDPTYANNGRGFETFAHIGDVFEAAATRHFVMSMVFDGVFERHPRLSLLLAECGHSWFPGFLWDIDAKTSKVAFDGQPHESFYKLPLKPSEYLQRQVRLAVVPGYIDIGKESLTVQQTLEMLPDPDMLIFSSDYPHSEGRKHAVSLLDPLLPDDEGIRESFFGGSIAQLAGL